MRNSFMWEESCGYQIYWSFFNLFSSSLSLNNFSFRISNSKSCLKAVNYEKNRDNVCTQGFNVQVLPSVGKPHFQIITGFFLHFKADSQVKLVTSTQNYFLLLLTSLISNMCQLSACLCTVFGNIIKHLITSDEQELNGRVQPSVGGCLLFSSWKGTLMFEKKTNF